LTLRELRVRQWRNLAGVTLRPGPRATVLFGENGQGKTNLVEAVHFLTTFRSFRTNHLEDVVPWRAEVARIEGDVAVGGLERKIEVQVAGARKTARLDGKAVRRDAAGLQGVAAVLFVPEDLGLARAAPAERRRFLDRAIFAADRGYSVEAVAYDRVLRSRNAVLREAAPRAALLDTYDEELARTGATIVSRRRTLADALAPRVEALFAAVHADLGARIRYRSHASLQEVGRGAVPGHAEPALQEALLAGLRSRRDLDRRRGFTGFGPHTDDLELELAGHPARDHGSQGQLRSLILALKLAELAHLEERLGEVPLLLLDDVASELDEVRRTRLFETIARLPGQTLMTVTDRDLLPTLPGRCDFEVKGGQIQPVGPPAGDVS
jgi:DNA replication and repair protein RecF